MNASDPHADQPVLTAGPSLASTAPAIVMLHGRNAAPRNILDLAPRLNRRRFSLVAPAAANNTWYPFSFLEPIEKNEPYLSSAIRRVHEVVADVAAAGVPRNRIVLLGFSQGACLAAEYAYRFAERFGGLIVFSGGLIGPPGTSWQPTRSFGGTPVFLGCSDVDAHVPKWRVEETADVFGRMNAAVDTRLYPGMGHLVSDDEIAAAQAVLDAVDRVSV